MLGDRGQPGGQRVDVTEHAGRRQAFGQRRGGRLDLAGVAGAGLQPVLHQRDLGGQVVEAAAEMRERGLGVARLPRADGPLAGGGDQPHRAVVVDPAEPVRIAGRAVGTAGAGGAARWARSRPRSGRGPGPGGVAGARCVGSA